MVYEEAAPYFNTRSLQASSNMEYIMTKHTLAYPQADIECPLYMQIPKGVNVGGTTKPKKTYVLQLMKNL
jgi:hypothetical protein